MQILCARTIETAALLLRVTFSLSNHPNRQQLAAMQERWSGMGTAAAAMHASCVQTCAKTAFLPLNFSLPLAYHHTGSSWLRCKSGDGA
jgi:hypothetical protein